MKSCIFCELIKKEIGDHRIFNTWCGDPGKVCHCYFWWWACWLFCCWALYWKWRREKILVSQLSSKVLLLGAVLETIAKENLLVATQAAGDTLLKGSNLALLEILRCHTTAQVSASWRSCTRASWRTREAEEPSVLLTAGCSIFTKYYEDHDGRNIMQIMVEEILCRSWQ